MFIDRDTINQVSAFVGDVRRRDEVLGDQLGSILQALNDEFWTAESG